MMFGEAYVESIIAYLSIQPSAGNRSLSELPIPLLACQVTSVTALGVKLVWLERGRSDFFVHLSLP